MDSLNYYLLDSSSPPPGCHSPLGMESRAISDVQISASSQWDANHAAIQGRLNFQAGGGKQGGWSAKANNQNQWLQVDLGKVRKVTHLATQGRNGNSQWVKSYKVEFSNNGSTFQFYKEQGADKVCWILICKFFMRYIGELWFYNVPQKLRRAERNYTGLETNCDIDKGPCNWVPNLLQLNDQVEKQIFITNNRFRWYCDEF